MQFAINMQEMQNTLNYDDFGKTCRFCLRSKLKLISIYNKDNSSFCEDSNSLSVTSNQNSPTNIADMISYISITISPNDGLPQFVCEECCDRLVFCCRFREQCLTSIDQLRNVQLNYEFSNVNVEELTNKVIDDILNDMDKNESTDKEHYTNNLFLMPEHELLNSDIECSLDSIDNIFHFQATSTPTIDATEVPTYIERLPLKTVIEPPTAKPKYVRRNQICPICGVSRKSLRSHILIHRELKLFTCDVCDKHFNTLALVKSHIKAVHVISDRKFKCTTCACAFKTKNHLERHNKSHRGVHDLQCEICENTFRDKSTLTRHRQSHTQERKVICVYCEKKFATTIGLRNHIGIHTGECMFSCGLCPMTFLNSSSASVHRRRHVRDQPFTCNICQMQFKNLGKYKHHLRSHNEAKKYNNVLVTL